MINATHAQRLEFAREAKFERDSITHALRAFRGWWLVGFKGGLYRARHPRLGEAMGSSAVGLIDQVRALMGGRR